jgi:hypothetical protein
MPMGADTTTLRPQIEQLRGEMTAAGKTTEVILVTSLPLDDPPRAIDQLGALAAAGVTRIVHGWRYADADAFRQAADTLSGRIGTKLRTT